MRSVLEAGSCCSGPGAGPGLRGGDVLVRQRATAQHSRPARGTVRLLAGSIRYILHMPHTRTRKETAHVSLSESGYAYHCRAGSRRGALRLWWGLFTWSALVNPFFSPEVRLQAERGQRVIHEGPYAIVRHPGYATNLLAVVATGLALNSLLSLLPAVLFAALTVRVTAIEDRML